MKIIYDTITIIVTLGTMPGLGRQRGALLVHLVAHVAVVGAAFRVRAGRDARGGVGGLLLLHRPRRAAQPTLLRPRRAARCEHDYLLFILPFCTRVYIFEFYR